MQWLISKSKVYVSLLLIACCSQVMALDESRLWLAKKHQVLYLPLWKAAAAAESIDRCVEVMEGTLDRGQSTSDHPIFRILCRQENGRSYNEMVDGITFETLTTPKVEVVELTPEEKERLRQEEEERARQALELRKQNLWQMCDSAIVERTKMMIEFQWAEPVPPEPIEIEDAGAEYRVKFDAKSIWGKALHYEALCQVTDSQVEKVELHKR